MYVCFCIQGRFTTEQIDHYGKACNASEGKNRFVVDIVYSVTFLNAFPAVIFLFDVTNII